MRPKLLQPAKHPAVPTVACVNHATIPLGVDFDRLIAALQKFADTCFSPAWGTPVKLVPAARIPPGAWGLVFLDDSDKAGFYGYHDLTPDGLPLGKVFVKTILAAKEKVSVTACHELCEMLVDPSANLCAAGPDGVFYAYEAADPVEEDEFLVDGIAMSNFVHPAWFESFRKPKSAQFDHLGLLTRPFQLRRGGYMPVFQHGRWTQLYGSTPKAKRHAKQDRTGRRCAKRQARAAGQPTRHSEVWAGNELPQDNIMTKTTKKKPAPKAAAKPAASKKPNKPTKPVLGGGGKFWGVRNG